MKKIYILSALILLVLALWVSGCFYQQDDARKDEAEQAIASLDRSRPIYADDEPSPPESLDEIRITVMDRNYAVPSFMEDLHNLSMMQIWYGYLSGGNWYDYPSENYNLVGIFQQSGVTGWEASLGSHIVKIGPYILINICVSNHPLESCVISDTLNTPIQEPFSQYHTYQYYVDAEGSLHAYMEDHDSGFGYIAENPNRKEADVDYTVVPEFRKRYYLILDYQNLRKDYRLSLSTYGKDGNMSAEYELGAETIFELIG